MSTQVVPRSDMVKAAMSIDWDEPGTTPISDAADARTRLLIDGFVHQAGPPPGQFTWVVLGSHARRELHCASDQDHALFWDTAQAASSSYAGDLAAVVIEGLAEFGMQPCAGGYMADRWSYSLDDWLDILRERVESPTPDAVVDADVFLDLRPLTGTLDVSPAVAELARGARSPRLMYGLARAANAFEAPRLTFGRLPRGEIDLKKSGLAPVVLLARLFGLKAGSPALATDDRLVDAGEAGALSKSLSGRLHDAYDLMTRLRLKNQLRQIEEGVYVTDRIDVRSLSDEDYAGLRDGFKSIKTCQTATTLAFRADL